MEQRCEQFKAKNILPHHTVYASNAMLSQGILTIIIIPRVHIGYGMVDSQRGMLHQVGYNHLNDIQQA